MSSCDTSSNTSKCGVTCPLTGFCFYFNKTFLYCFIFMLIWVNGFSFFWHSSVMGEMYKETASLWRIEGAMIQWSLFLGLGIFAFFSTYVFLQGYKGSGIKEGLRFGIILSFLFTGMLFIPIGIENFH